MKQITVDGETCKFYPKNHTYKVGDEVIPSVTTVTNILSKGQYFLNWLVNQTAESFEDQLEPGQEYDEGEIAEMVEKAKSARYKTTGKAKKIGTLVHKYAENYIKKQLGEDTEPEMPYSDEAQNSIERFLDWIEEHEIEWIGSEQLVFDPDVRYAGTFDAKARLGDTIYILDFKTSNGIYESYYLQASAYAVAENIRLALNEIEDAEPVQGAGIIRFPKTSEGFEVELIDKGDMIEHASAFRACKKLYDWKQSFNN